MEKTRNTFSREKFESEFPSKLQELCDTPEKSRNLKECLGCTTQAINQYKLGHAFPKIENIIKIARFFNCSLDYLVRLSDVQSPNAEIQAICDYTGLSEKAVEVLHFLSSPRENQEDKAAHKQIIDLLNLILERNYSDTVKYCEEEKELKHILENRYPSINMDEAEKYPPDTDDHNDDPCPRSISNIFSTMYQYINPHDSSLSFFDGKNRTTVTGAAVALDSNGETTAFSVNEIIRTTLFDRIKKQLSALTKEER